MGKKLLFGLFTLLVLVFSSTSLGYAESTKEKRLTEASPRATNKGRLESCQARLEAVKTRSTHMVELAENMFAKFGAIQTRTQEFYVKKGLMIDNYEELLADIASKKIVVETNLDITSEGAENFNCENNPKEQVTQYKASMKNVVMALKDYRKSIRNLIVAVHSNTK